MIVGLRFIAIGFCAATGLAVVTVLAATSPSLSSRSEITQRAAEVAGSVRDRDPVTNESGPNDALQAWLSENAVTVRSIDSGDADFSDLEPLIDAIGTARLVQLGEPSHGAGSSFAAKVRLIKFLYQRMGFDVVAWESGMYGLRLTQADLRTGNDSVAAAQRGIFNIWSGAEELRPLFEFARSTQGSMRPLEMAGFDIQITAEKSAERFATDLDAFIQAVRNPSLRQRAAALAARAVATYQRMRSWTKSEKTAVTVQTSDRENLIRSADGLLAEIRNHHADFAQVHSSVEIALMGHAIENMREDGLNMYSNKRADRPTGSAELALRSEEWNRRDARMATNLRWLLEDVYPGRKVIVWAHNAHIMNAHFAADWRSVHHVPQPGGMTPSGAHLAGWLDDDVYTIALTTYEGEDGWANGQRQGPIAPAAEGSLEARLHRLGKPYLFLDLRSLRHQPKVRLPTALSMRISGYGPPNSPYGNDAVPDLTKAFDAIFYIDRMAPASRITEHDTSSR